MSGKLQDLSEGDKINRNSRKPLRTDLNTIKSFFLTQQKKMEGEKGKLGCEFQNICHQHEAKMIHCHMGNSPQKAPLAPCPKWHHQEGPQRLSGVTIQLSCLP